MSINFKNNVSFGMAIISTKEIQTLLEKNLSNKSANKLNKLIAEQAKNPVDVYLKKEKYYEFIGWDAQNRPLRAKREIFAAQVKDKTFFGNIFSPYMSAIKKAVAYARKLNKNQELLQNIKN